MRAPTAPPTAAEPAISPGRRWLITGSIMLATIMQVLDTTIANVALPHMQGSLSASQDQISWVITSYVVAAAVMTPPTGWLAARLGRRRLFLMIVAGFTVASMLCGAATTLWQIVVCRLLQGACGAGLVPLSQLILLDTFPREKHGQAMAVWGVGVMVGPILGPTLGGWLTEYYNWRWVFYVNLPFGLLALAGIFLFVPETRRDVGKHFDIAGFTLLSVAIGSVQLMLDRGELLDWFSSTEIIAEGTIGALAFYLFLVHLFTTDRPFIEPRLFTDRNFVTGISLMFMLGCLLIATMALLPTFLQAQMQYPVLMAGMVLAPRGIGNMASLALAGRLIGKVDPRLILIAGFGCNAVAFWEMSQFTADVSVTAIVLTGTLQGFGVGLVFPTLSVVAFATIAPYQRADAASMFSLMRNIGASIGVSVVIARLTSGIQRGHAVLSEHVSPFRDPLNPGLLPPSWDWRTLTGLTNLDNEVTRQAALASYLDVFTFLALVALVAFPMAMMVKPARPAPAATA